MRLYNTSSQHKEELAPHDNMIRLYVCGITPYDTTHLGHMFTYASFDVLVRFLEWQQIQVRYVQNVTDIDDDVLRKAKEVGVDWYALGNEWTARFVDDMRALNVRPPDEYPRATAVIPQIVELIQALVRDRFAYVSDGNVYYDVDAFPEFGKLSHLPRPEMLPIANERGNRPDDPHKRDPLDFVLWQRKANDEPAWPSPWGEGRPGWHIECTAMVNRFLGPTIDIHGGGGDLVFPHHECEIAQSEAATQRAPFAHHWMHVAMVRKDGEKMSKSLGNLVMISSLLEQYRPDALRLYLASHHYRQVWEHDARELEQSSHMARQWKTAAGSEENGTPDRVEDVRQEFREAMEDDLDTPRAIRALDALANDINANKFLARELPAAQATLLELAGVLGLRLGRVGLDPRVAAGWSKHRTKFESSLV